MVIPMSGSNPSIYAMSGHTNRTSGQHANGNGRRASIVPSHTHLSLEEDDGGDFLPMDESYDHTYHGNHNQPTPYHLSTSGPSMQGTSPHTMSMPSPGYNQTPMMMHHHLGQMMIGGNGMPSFCPTDQMHFHSSQFSTPGAGPSSTPSQYIRHPQGRQNMPHRHTGGEPQSAPNRPAPLQRHYSMQVPQRPNPQMVANDVFAVPPGSMPVRRNGSMDGTDSRAGQNGFEFDPNQMGVSRRNFFQSIANCVVLSNASRDLTCTSARSCAFPASAVLTPA